MRYATKSAKYIPVTMGPSPGRSWHIITIPGSGTTDYVMESCVLNPLIDNVAVVRRHDTSWPKGGNRILRFKVVVRGLH